MAPSSHILGMRRNFAIFVVIVLYTVGPLLSALLASSIAIALDCDLDEGSVHPCNCYGVDLGGLLYSMGTMGWLSLVTLPTGFGAIVVFLIWVAATAIGPKGPS